MVQSLDKLAKSCADDTLLIYFSGHGELMAGKLMLVLEQLAPTDEERQAFAGRQIIVEYSGGKDSSGRSISSRKRKLNYVSLTWGPIIRDSISSRMTSARLSAAGGLFCARRKTSWKPSSSMASGRVILILLPRLPASGA
jgi:hypothetical protein